ncbi:MAG: hydrogenase expression/formation C-terminal domain-containing protein [Gammaproteobacteria bacterium]
MSRLADIGVRVEGPTPETIAAGGLGGGVSAVLSELVALLERLAELKTPGVIDLRSLPMSPQDRVALQAALGQGEVQASVDAGGLSSIRETRVAGVWWVEHRNGDGELIAELLEVTQVPAILARAPDEIAAGAHALREQITAAHGIARHG